MLFRRIPKKMLVTPQMIMDSPRMISVYILEMPGKGNMVHENDALAQETQRQQRKNMLETKGSHAWDRSQTPVFSSSTVPSLALMEKGHSHGTP